MVCARTKGAKKKKKKKRRQSGSKVTIALFISVLVQCLDLPNLFDWLGVSVPRRLRPGPGYHRSHPTAREERRRRQEQRNPSAGNFFFFFI